MFNNAKWISTRYYPDMMTENAEEFTRSILVRCEFSVKDNIKNAELVICGLGLCRATVNGNNVTDAVLCTPFTTYDKRVLYDVYDITMHITMGVNCLGVHLGNGFYNNNMSTWKDKMAPWRDVPKVIFSIKLTYCDGTYEYINSDRNLKTMPGPVLFNHMRQGEMYDAGFDENGWNSAGFDDSKWYPAKRVNPPGGVLEKTNMPPIRECETYKPISIKNGIYDFGVNISGYVRIKVNCEAGRKIELYYDEHLNDEGTKLSCDREFKTESELNSFRGANAFCLIEHLEFAQKNVYITKGGGQEVWSPLFCYHGFRFVKVINAPEDFEIEAVFVHTDFEQTGTFRCDDEKLNTLHDMAIRTLLSNNVGIPTDCPHREQNGWPGDAILASHCAYYNYDMYSFYRSWLKNYRELQRPSGQVPCLLPSAGWGFNWGGSPMTDGTLIRLPYFSYLYTGKTDMIYDLWDTMVKYFDFIDMVQDNGVVEYGINPDWSCSNLKVVYPVAARDTIVTCFNLDIMCKMAKLIGKDDKPWLELYKKYYGAWYKNFGSQKDLWHSQTFLTQSVYYGGFKGDDIAPAVDKLAEYIKNEDYHINSGIGGMFTMFDVLSDNGAIEVLYKAIMNETYPSYRYWVKCGLTTFAEDWDMSQSHNHQMFCEVDAWLYRHIAGIRYTDDGLLIKPVKLKSVSKVKATHNGVKVDIDGDCVQLKLPCRARVVIGDTDAYFDAGEYTFKM